MAIENPVHMNEGGLPLNAIQWLEIHHRSKLMEREQMIQDLRLSRGCRLVDAGCGPGLWTPLLAGVIGSDGQIIGVDVSDEALVTARQRCQNQWYQEQVRYMQGSLEYLPVANGSIHTIFSANVSQYLPEPARTFAGLGRYLMPGGQLVVKDIDFGTLQFHTIDAALQARVLGAREMWEQHRHLNRYLFEDSWVGSKLAGYFQDAGYENVDVKRYKIVRRAPLTPDFRMYLEGIAHWFICEDAPFLSQVDAQLWLRCFTEGVECVFEQEDFCYEETEYLVTGTWPGCSARRFFDMSEAALEQAASENTLTH